MFLGPDVGWRRSFQPSMNAPMAVLRGLEVLDGGEGPAADRPPGDDAKENTIFSQDPEVGWADVTEGIKGNWERERYKWNAAAGTVTAVTTDASFWDPGSRWDYKLAPQGASTRVDHVGALWQGPEGKGARCAVATDRQGSDRLQFHRAAPGLLTATARWANSDLKKNSPPPHSQPVEMAASPNSRQGWNRARFQTVALASNSPNEGRGGAMSQMPMPTAPERPGQKRLFVISAGLGQPSSTRLLADRLSQATVAELEVRGLDVDVQTLELRDLALDVTTRLVSGLSTPALDAAVESLGWADGMIVVSPVFAASYSGLFKSFFDVVEPDLLVSMPAIIGATGGSERHSLALDHAMRPLFAYLRTVVVPTGVYAATADWGAAGRSGTGLASRVRRAAGELAALLEFSVPRESKDPFALPPTFDPSGLRRQVS